MSRNVVINRVESRPNICTTVQCHDLHFDIIGELRRVSRHLPTKTIISVLRNCGQAEVGISITKLSRKLALLLITQTLCLRSTEKLVFGCCVKYRSYHQGESSSQACPGPGEWENAARQPSLHSSASLALNSNPSCSTVWLIRSLSGHISMFGLELELLEQ